jgi:hypothetical protein
MAKQAIKKGTGIKKTGLSSFKEKLGLNSTDKKTTTVSNANKPQSWIIMPKAFQEATKLSGIPESTVVSVIGHSNVGKTTLINHAITSAQRQGLIPVIIDTENSFSFQYAKSMGFSAEPIFGDVEVEDIDPETGEITTHTENQIIHWDGNFLYYNNHILCERFGDIDYAKGVKTKTKRKIAVVEDVASAINELLDAQDNGEIDQGFLFVWDSVGSIGCYKEYNSGAGTGKIGNPMWTAAAISAAFNLIVNDRIPSSRKVSSKYSNTFLYVNKVWMDSMTNPVGPAIMQTKGGKSLKYATRLEILMGGQLTSGIKRLTATSKGVTYSYGIETKVKILKNHLDAPHNVCYEGKMIASDLGFISPDDLDEYKKEHINEILKELNRLSEGDADITAKDVEFGETEDETIE